MTARPGLIRSVIGVTLFAALWVALVFVLVGVA